MRLVREIPPEPGSRKKLGVFICGACGREITINLSHGKGKTYCSRECKADLEATMWGPGRVDVHTLTEPIGSKSVAPDHDYGKETLDRPRRGAGYFNYRGDKEKDISKSPKVARRSV